MRICDLKDTDIKTGMRVRAMYTKPGRTAPRIGTIVNIKYPVKLGETFDPKKHDRYQFSEVQWDGDDQPYSGFWENDCEMEVVTDEETNN